MSDLPAGPVILWAKNPETGDFKPFSAPTINEAIQNLGRSGPIDGFVLTGEPIELAPKSKKAKAAKTPPKPAATPKAPAK